MGSPPVSDGRRWRIALERVGPDGLRRRLLLGATGGIASVVAATYGLNFMLGPLNLGAIEFLGGALLALGGTVGLVTSAVVLLPAVVSLFGYASEALATDGPIGRSGSDESDEDDPIAVLKQRYAAGEIGDEEFEQRLDRLLNARRRDDDADPDPGRTRGRGRDRDLDRLLDR